MQFERLSNNCPRPQNCARPMEFLPLKKITSSFLGEYCITMQFKSCTRFYFYSMMSHKFFLWKLGMKTASTSAKIRLQPWEMKGSENIGLYFECTVFPDIFCFFFPFRLQRKFMTTFRIIIIISPVSLTLFRMQNEFFCLFVYIVSLRLLYSFG